MRQRSGTDPIKSFHIVPAQIDAGQHIIIFESVSFNAPDHVVRQIQVLQKFQFSKRCRANVCNGIRR